MNYQVMPEAEVKIQRITRQRIEPGYRFPSVSIFLPFDPKMGMKNKLMFSLAKATDKVVYELRDKYPGEMSMLLVRKLKDLIKNLDFNTHKKSLAIFISPVFEKIYYLDMDIEEKVIVNESLQFRDLVYNKKQSLQFHLLLLSEQECRIFFSNTKSFVRIIPGEHKSIIQKDTAEQAAKLTDDSEKEFATEKFLHQVDHSLGNILKRNRLPVFVMGTEKIVGQFKKITRHDEAILEYVQGNYEASSSEDLKKILKQQIGDWQKIKQKNLLTQLKEASNKNKLSFGLDNVLHEEVNGRSRLLIIEEKYLYENGVSQTSIGNDNIFSYYNKFSCIKNPIDEMIEKVLENGGDVEIVSNGLLKDYYQIALI